MEDNIIYSLGFLNFKNLFFLNFLFLRLFNASISQDSVSSLLPRLPDFFLGYFHKDQSSLIIIIIANG